MAGHEGVRTPGLEMKVLFLKRLQTLKNAFPSDVLTHSLFLDFQQNRLAESRIIGINSFGPRPLEILSQTHPGGALRKIGTRRVRSLIKVFDPDVLFTAFQDPEIIGLAGDIPIVHWDVEVRLSQGGEDRFSSGFADKCAHVFTAATSHGSHEFLPLAVSPWMFKPVPGAEKKYLVTFTGSWYPDREEMFKMMLYPLGSDAHTFGRDWPRTDRNGVHHHRRVDPTGLPRVYSSSSVCLNIHHPDVARNGGLNLRTFEILACQGLMVCDEVVGMDRFLSPGVDFIQYKRSQSIRDVVRDAIEAEGRRRISLNGYKTFLSRHTTLHRAKRIAERMQSL